MKGIALAAVVAVVLAVGAAAAVTAGVLDQPAHILATDRIPEPMAFQRPARADDRYSGLHRSWRVSDSRLVARSLVRRPNRVNVARLYLVRRTNGTLCVILRDGAGESASCISPSAFTKGASLAGRLLAGVVGNEVTRVVVVGTRGVSHTVKLTRDRGFIWDCRAWNGCSGVIAAVEAYNDAGRLLYRTTW